MLILSLVLALLLQQPQAPAVPPAPATPSASVVVGLVDGQQLAIDDPIFNGFIESHQSGETVLLYRQKNFRGELKLSSIQRIDFGYKKGKPFPLSVTLKNGQKLELQSDRRNFVTLTGSTDTGSVTVKHPNPIATPQLLTTRNPNRKSNLTIQYLEFPR